MSGALSRRFAVVLKNVVSVVGAIILVPIAYFLPWVAIGLLGLPIIWVLDSGTEWLVRFGLEEGTASAVTLWIACLMVVALVALVYRSIDWDEGWI